VGIELGAYRFVHARTFSNKSQPLDQTLSRPLVDQDQRQTDESDAEALECGQQKLYAAEEPEGYSQMSLAALCNAGDLSGLRGIHDRPRRRKVSMKRKEESNEGARERQILIHLATARERASLDRFLAAD